MSSLCKVDSGHGVSVAKIIGGHDSAKSQLSEPLVYFGSLDNFKQQDLTPMVGREFEGLQVTDLLQWGDEMIRDLAITSTMLSTLSCIIRLTSSFSLTTRSRLSARPEGHTDSNERPHVTHN
jgi:hypothetical protein